jgi:hypothetical protein
MVGFWTVVVAVLCRAGLLLLVLPLMALRFSCAVSHRYRRIHSAAATSIVRKYEGGSTPVQQDYREDTAARWDCNGTLSRGEVSSRNNGSPSAWQQDKSALPRGFRDYVVASVGDRRQHQSLEQISTCVT